MAHGLSCSVACGIISDQGLNLCPLHWQVESNPLYHQGSPIFFAWYDLFKAINKKKIIHFKWKQVFL